MPRLHPPQKSAVLELPPFVGIAPADISVPHAEHELCAAWADLSAHSHIGFDTESRPTFVKGQESTGPDVVQFATPSRAYVLQLRHRGCVELARSVLTARGVIKVGFDLRQDQTQLLHRLGVQASPLLDLDRVFHREGYPRSIGIKSAVAIVFGQRFVKSKRVATTNWSNERLDARQVLYAANDAFVALRVLYALGLNSDELRDLVVGGAGFEPATPAV